MSPVVPLRSPADLVVARAASQAASMLELSAPPPDSFAVVLERNPHLAQRRERRKALLAGLVALFVSACGAPPDGAPSEADAGPSCIDRARVCLEAAQVKADVSACRAAWESCGGRTQ